MSRKHSIPDYFIADMQSAGWKARLGRFEGNSGVFIFQIDELIVVSYAQLWEAGRISPEYTFEPHIAIGTKWFKQSFKNIAGYPSADGWFINEHSFNFTSAEYSYEFIENSTQEILAWAESYDVREAMRKVANLPEGWKRPPNAPIYVVAKAILGQKEELMELAKNVAAGTDEVVSNLVKLEHLEHAIDCCDNPSKYGYPEDVIKYMRAK